MPYSKRLFQLVSWLLLAAMLLSSFTPVYAQDNGPTPEATLPAPDSGSISGHVTDRNGNPLAGVTVSDRQGHETLSDADGNYTLSGLPAGRHTLWAALENAQLRPYYRVVDLSAGSAASADFVEAGAEAAVDRQDALLPLAGNEPPTGEIAPETAAEEEVAAQAYFVPGEVGLSYRYAGSYGTNGAPYLNGTDTLNGPIGLGTDPDGKILIVENAGHRLLRYTLDGTYDNLSIGKAGVGYYDDEQTLLPSPTDVVADASGNLYISSQNRIQKFDPSGALLWTYPSSQSWRAGNDNERFNQPASLALNGDASLLYVADKGNQRVQIFSFDAEGRPQYVNSLTGFGQPVGLTYFDNMLYVVDRALHVVYRCDPAAGACSVFYGKINEAGSDLEHLDMPNAIALTATQAYISDGANYRVLSCTVDAGAITACTHWFGTAGIAGNDDEHLRWPADLLIGTNGKIYLADQDNHRLLAINSSGSLTLQIGGTPYNTDENHFNAPYGLTLAPGGGLYVTENAGKRLLNLSPDGFVEWAAGIPGLYGTGKELFGTPGAGPSGSPASDAQGRIYVADPGNHRVKIYLPDGTLFGQLGEAGVSGTDNQHFDYPASVAISPTSGDIFVSDYSLHRIQVFDSQLQYKATIGATATPGSDSDHFNGPLGLAAEAGGTLLVADYGNQRVLRCNPAANGSGACSLIAGIPGVSGAGFNRLNGPIDVKVANGLLFIVDLGASRVLVFDATGGAFRTQIGGARGDRSGELRAPTGVAVASDGSVYVADRDNHRIQKYVPNVPGWEQINLNGFANIANNSVSALGWLKGELYAGTTNPAGAQLWRRTTAGTWSAVTNSGFGQSGLVAIKQLIEYNGYFYAGTQGWLNNAPAANRLWRCPVTSDCGLSASWSELTTWPLRSDNLSDAIRQMVVLDGKLYVATGVNGDAQNPPHGAQVWRFDGATWQKSFEALKDSANPADPTYYHISVIQAMTVHDNALYIGLARWQNQPTPAAAGGQVWRCLQSSACDAPADWELLVDDGDFAGNEFAVSALAAHQGKLYAGVSMFSGEGGVVYRLGDCTAGNCTWDAISAAGFGDALNENIPGLVSYDDSLFAFTWNADTGTQVWSYDGTDWSKSLADDGLGSNQNQLAIGALKVNGGYLYLGSTASNAGGQLWVKQPSHYTISGAIAGLPAGVEVIVQLDPGEHQTQTDHGAYSFAGIPNGAYTVTPIDSRYQFTPAAQNVTVASANVDDVNFTKNADYPVQLLAPANGSLTASRSVSFDWSDAAGANVRYQWQISTSSTFATVDGKSGLLASNFTAALQPNTRYYWRIRPYTGASPAADAPWSQVWSLTTPTSIAAPVLHLPKAKAILTTLRPTLSWVSVTGAVAYRVQMSGEKDFSDLIVDERVEGRRSLVLTQSLPPYQDLYWRVQAINNSQQGGPWSVVRELSVPIGPTKLIAPLDTTPTSLLPQFEWQALQGISRYSLQIDGKDDTFTYPLAFTTNNTTYTLTQALTPGKVYWWRVCARGKYGDAVCSDAGKFTTPTPPAVPSLLAPANKQVLADPAALLTWSAISGASYYHIQFASQSSFVAGSLWETTTTTNQYNDYSKWQFQYNGQYWWRVRACNAQNQCSNWPATWSFSIQPGNITLQEPENNKIIQEYSTRFQWEPGNAKQTTGSLVYTLQIARDDQFKSLYKTVNTTLTSASFNAPVGTYYWRVGSKGAGGQSAWSETRKFTTQNLPLPPTLLTPANNAVVSLQTPFTWSPVAGAAIRYNIQYATASDFSRSAFTEENASGDALDPAHFTTGTWYWRVQTCNAAGCGKWSASRKVITRGGISGRLSPDKTSAGDILYNLQLAGNGVNRTRTGVTKYVAESDLPAGSYRLDFTSTGYLPLNDTVVVANGKNTEYNRTMVSLPSDLEDYTFLLQWNDGRLVDLDAYLWLPQATPAEVSPRAPGALAQFPFALSQFNTHTANSSVQTITLDAQNLQAGVYNLSVYLNPITKAKWSTAGAKLMVYKGSTLIAGPFQAAAGKGNWWNVLRFENGAVTPLNTFQSTSPAPYAGYTVSGKVQVQVDGVSRPLGGASLSLNGRLIETGRPNGEFTFYGLGNGAYTLTPAVPGYTFNPASIDITVNNGNITGLNLTATPDHETVTAPSGGALRTSGDYVYAGNNNRLDVHDTTGGGLIAKRKVSLEPISDIEFAGSYAYTVQGKDGINIFDISDPQAAKLAGSLYQYTDGKATVSLNVSDITIRGNYAYLVTPTKEMHVLDVSNPASPRWLARLGLPDYADHILLYKQYAYLYADAGNSWFMIVDITSATRPRYLKTFQTGFAFSSIATSQGYLIFNEGPAAQTISVYRLSDPKNPTFLTGNDSLAIDFGNVLAAGKRLYVATGEKISVWDFSDPRYNPQLLGYIGNAIDREDPFDFSNDALFVLDAGNATLDVLPISSMSTD